MQFPAMNATSSPWKWLALMAALSAGGCAGGAWLERSLTAELPVDGPQNGYPTALRNGDEPARQSQPPGAGVVQATISDIEAPAEPGVSDTANMVQVPPSPAPANTAHSSNRLERQHVNLPVLAVVPPQYVANPAPPRAAQSLPTPATPQAHAVNDVSALPANDAGAPYLVPAADALRTTAVAANTNVIGAGATTPIAQDGPPSDDQAPALLDGPARLDKVRGDLIETLESEVRRRREANTTDEELPRLEQQLRLAYVAAGRLDDAVAAVDSLDAAQREAYKNLMFGLGVWLSPDEARRAPLRTAKVLHSLRDATTDLAASSKLELRNLVFCERVDYFGWYTEFPRKEFQPKQQVILYVEVQNFAAEQKGPAGYETELQGSYEILDASGQIIASRQLPLDKEICRNYRRDYFLAYRIYMPDAIAPGRYRLELTVEDLKARGKFQGRKLGEGMIEFAIR